jgi:hypothetical protein
MVAYLLVSHGDSHVTPTSALLATFLVGQVREGTERWAVLISREATSTLWQSNLGESPVFVGQRITRAAFE